MVLQKHTNPKVAAVDDDDSSTCSQLRRKRQRIESTSNDGGGGDHDDDNDGGDALTVQQQQQQGLANVNHYKGWTVPESNYRIPILSFKDDDLEPEKFYQNYVRRRRPVVIKGGLPIELKHLDKWKSSNEDMIQRAGDELIVVEKRSSNHDSFGKGNEVSMSFRRFMTLLQDGDTLHYLTTQDVEANRDGRPELMAPFMKKLQQRRDGDSGGGDSSSGDVDVDAAFPLRPKITGNLVPQNINLWIGNSQTGASSGLHHDYHDNLYIVLRGTKRFRLFGPSDTEKMYTWGKLETVHANGRINYEGETTTAYGADPSSHAAAEAARSKEDAEERLAAAEQAVEEGKPGAEEALEAAEALLDEAMEAILDAETGGDYDGDDDGEEAFCLETATEEDVEGIDVDQMSSSSEEGGIDDDDDNDDGSHRRIVDKTVKNPNNFSKADPSVLDDREKLQTDFPKILDAKAAFCELSSGDMLYLPASWFHEVTSSSDGGGSSNGTTTTTTKGHMAFNYWFHPPDAENDFENPYTTDFWPNDLKDRFK
jgi:hypothetical protein